MEDRWRYRLRVWRRLPSILGLVEVEVGLEGAVERQGAVDWREEERMWTREGRSRKSGCRRRGLLRGWSSWLERESCLSQHVVFIR